MSAVDRRARRQRRRDQGLRFERLERADFEAVELGEVARAALADMLRAHDDTAVTEAALAERWQRWRPAMDAHPKRARLKVAWLLYQHAQRALGREASWSDWLELLNADAIREWLDRSAARQRPGKYDARWRELAERTGRPVVLASVDGTPLAPRVQAALLEALEAGHVQMRPGAVNHVTVLHCTTRTVALSAAAGAAAGPTSCL
jgi:hypothetical protein